MQFDSATQAISDAFDLLAEQQKPGPYAVANDYVSAETYAGSICEAVDNMSQRELDHLKGRECDPADGCEACDRIRAYYAVLEAAVEAQNVYPNLQSNPIRDRSTLLSTYHLRLHRAFVPNLGWIRTLACNCCSMPTAHPRYWQKRLSKQTTLRSHRPRK
jgi:hypothetical protein